MYEKLEYTKLLKKHIKSLLYGINTMTSEEEEIFYGHNRAVVEKVCKDAEGLSIFKDEPWRSCDEC